MLTRFSSACLSAWASAHSSICCADQPCCKAQPSLSRQLLLQCRLFCIAHLRWNCFRQWIVPVLGAGGRCLSGSACSSKFYLWLLIVMMGVPASLDKNMMGFSIHTVSSWTWGFLQISLFAKQWIILELFSHLCPWLFIREVTVWGNLHLYFAPE